MANKRLRVLLEGNDDERFFEDIIKPILSPQYDLIQVWQYAQQPRRRTKNFLRAIKAMNSHYIFLGDINKFPCVTAKIESLKNKYGRCIDAKNVTIVVKEIESWYLAGLDDKSRKELRIRTSRDTDNITKEKFNKLIPSKFDSRIDFMIEILKRFSIETGVQKNSSFAYFMNKILS